MESEELEFRQLNIPAEVMEGIQKAGFSQCTPIQALTLPVALEGRDVAGQAQTGTGKTAAFLVAMYSHLLRNPPGDQSRWPCQPAGGDGGRSRSHGCPHFLEGSNQPQQPIFARSPSQH